MGLVCAQCLPGWREGGKRKNAGAPRGALIFCESQSCGSAGMLKPGLHTQAFSRELPRQTWRADQSVHRSTVPVSSSAPGERGGFASTCRIFRQAKQREALTNGQQLGTLLRITHESAGLCCAKEAR